MITIIYILGVVFTAIWTILSVIENPGIRISSWWQPPLLLVGITLRSLLWPWIVMEIIWSKLK